MKDQAQAFYEMLFPHVNDNIEYITDNLKALLASLPSNFYLLKNYIALSLDSLARTKQCLDCFEGIITK